MNFATSIKTCYSKYATFSGRASRSEYWWFALFFFIAEIAIVFLDGALFGKVTVTGSSFQSSSDRPILSLIFILTTFLPALSVLVRRLHDQDKSGWWYWIVLVPIAGVFILIYFLASEGTKGANRFGTLDGQDAPDNDSGDFTKSGVPTISRN